MLLSPPCRAFLSRSIRSRLSGEVSGRGWLRAAGWLGTLGGRRQLTVLWCLGLACCLAAGCGGTTGTTTGEDAGPATVAGSSSDSQPDASNPGSAATTDASTASEEAELKYPVPDGSPQELLEFIAEISQQRPQGDSPEAIGDDLRELLRSRLHASNKLLAAGPIQEIQMGAIENKLDALRALAIIDPEGLGQQFQPFVAELKSSGNTQKVVLAEVAEVQADVERFGNGQLTDPSPLMVELRRLIQEHDDQPVVFWASRYAGSVFEQTGHGELAREVYTRAGEAFQEFAADEQLAVAARTLVDQAGFLGIQLKASAAMGGDLESLQQLLDTIETMMNESQDAANTLAIAAQTAQMFEYAGQLSPAGRVYDLMLDKYGQADDELLAQSVQRTVRLARKRLGLGGQELVLQGVTHDRQAFDWSSYRGKKVLVDFFTSYADPGFMNEIEELYAQYHDRGLEIVGINLDENATERDTYLQQHPLPWVVVINPDPAEAGMEDTNAAQCGVESIPFRVLVDEEGKAVDWNLFGDRLRETLEATFRQP